jgi:Flp pilus assembly protein TadG
MLRPRIRHHRTASGAPGVPARHRRAHLSLHNSLLRDTPLRDTQGAAILEFAISLPLLVVFVVGIYDFSGAFNEKQKIEQAAQEGAIIAGSQPMSDIASSNGNPTSLQAVTTAVFNSLAASGVLPNANTGTCNPPGTVTATSGIKWTYEIQGCSNNPPSTATGCMGDGTDTLWIEINRGWVVQGGGSSPAVVGSRITVSYDYDWRFNSAIQLLFPGAGYAARTCIAESSSVHNQM